VQSYDLAVGGTSSPAGLTYNASNQQWSLAVSSQLSDGVYDVEVKVKALVSPEIPADGNNAAVPAVYSETKTDLSSGELIIDTTPPAIPLLANIDITDAALPQTGSISSGSVTNDSRPMFTGSDGEPGSTIQIYDVSSEIGSALVASNGTWTFQPTVALSEGSHSFTFKALDSFGNLSEQSAAFTFTVDTVAPIKPVLNAQIATNTGLAPSVTYALNAIPETGDNTPQLSGTAEGGSVVKIYSGTQLLGSTTADPNGVWTYAHTTPLADGTYTFKVSATDIAGNISVFSDSIQLSVAVAKQAIGLISAYADIDAPSANQTPAIDTYLAAGVVGVTSGNLIAINQKIAESTTDGTNTLNEIQAIVDAYIEAQSILAITIFRSSSIPVRPERLLTNTWPINGMASLARFPRTSGFTGTSRQDRTSRSSIRASSANFLRSDWRVLGSADSNTKPAPYSPFTGSLLSRTCLK